MPNETDVPNSNIQPDLAQSAEVGRAPPEAEALLNFWFGGGPEVTSAPGYKGQDVVNTGLLDEGMATLIDALEDNQGLRHLYLGTNGLTEATATRLAHYLAHHDRLESLFVACGRFGDDGVIWLVEGLSLNHRLLCSTRYGTHSTWSKWPSRRKRPNGPSAATNPNEAKVNPQESVVVPPPEASNTHPATTEPIDAAAKPPKD